MKRGHASRRRAKPKPAAPRKPKGVPSEIQQAAPVPAPTTAMAGASITLDELQQVLGALGSAHPDLVRAPQGGDPLFHYTDLYGLTGIIQSQDLWLTHSRFCNDNEEIVHGTTVARKVIADLRAKAAAPNGYLEGLAAIVDTVRLENVYICCFCRQDNLLSQWRSYGANGTGVSIRLAPGAFSAVAGPDCSVGLMRLWNVTYARDRQEEILRNAIQTLPLVLPSAPALMAQKAADLLSFFIPTFKNGDFSEEREWRLIFTPIEGAPLAPSFRVGRNMLVPYYSLKAIAAKSGLAAWTLPIQGVRIGPSANKQINVDSARLFLAQNGLAAASVDASETPYRG